MNEDITITYLPAELPYLAELTDQGEWPRTTWVSPARTTIELFVAGAFDPENTHRREVTYRDGTRKKINQQLRRLYHFTPDVPVEIPSIYDREVQRLQCYHPHCLQQPFDCRSEKEGHEKMIVGGLGPHMRRVSAAKLPKIHPSISDPPAAAPQPALLEAIAQKPIDTPESLAMARARARRAAAVGGQ